MCDYSRVTAFWQVWPHPLEQHSWPVGQLSSEAHSSTHVPTVPGGRAGHSPTTRKKTYIHTPYQRCILICIIILGMQISLSYRTSLIWKAAKTDHLFICFLLCCLLNVTVPSKSVPCVVFLFQNQKCRLSHIFFHGPLHCCLQAFTFWWPQSSRGRTVYFGQFTCLASPKKQCFIESGEYCCNKGHDNDQSLLKEQE